jgi:hypothetical protein
MLGTRTWIRPDEKNVGLLLAFTLAMTVVTVVGARPALALDPEPGWQEGCVFTQSKQVDPIVSPGVPSAHMHDFFATYVDANTTYESLRAGGTVCPLKDDTAGYWVPSLYTPNAQGVPTKRTPSAISVYYQGAELGQEDFQPFPPNLKIIAGNAQSPPEGQDLSIVWFDCAPNEEYSPRAHAPYLCQAGHYVRAHIKFPSCWDGVAPAPVGNDSAHMRYPSKGACPDGYVPVPELHMVIAYKIQDGRGATLASGGGLNDPTSIYTMHADYFHAWEQGLFEQLVENCLNEDGPEVSCGVLTTPFIKRISPVSGQPGDIVTIGGSGLVGVQSVKFNGTPATITVSGSRFISVIVPPGATTGPVSVSVDAGTGTDLRINGASRFDFVVD